MENYIYINGQKIALTEEEIRQIAEDLKCVNTTQTLASVSAGETFTVAGIEFIVLEQQAEKTMAITKKIQKKMKFGSSNNFDQSAADKWCIIFGEKIAEAIGGANLLEHLVDLTAEDGLKDYGIIKRRAALLTAEQCRAYVEVLDRHKPKEHWWLATPKTTPAHWNDHWALCVSPSGCVDIYYCDYDFGVRPFCIFKSDILVSLGKQ